MNTPIFAALLDEQMAAGMRPTPGEDGEQPGQPPSLPPPQSNGQQREGVPQ